MEGRRPGSAGGLGEVRAAPARTTSVRPPAPWRAGAANLTGSPCRTRNERPEFISGLFDIRRDRRCHVRHHSVPRLRRPQARCSIARASWASSTSLPIRSPMAARTTRIEAAVAHALAVGGAGRRHPRRRRRVDPPGRRGRFARRRTAPRDSGHRSDWRAKPSLPISHRHLQARSDARRGGGRRRLHQRRLSPCAAKARWMPPPNWACRFA